MEKQTKSQMGFLSVGKNLRDRSPKQNKETKSESMGNDEGHTSSTGGGKSQKEGSAEEL